MKKDDFGVFEIVLPAVDGQLAIPHKSKLKVSQMAARGVGILTIHRSL
jgi:1,4-alpha-glucan branching enzyme